MSSSETLENQKNVITGHLAVADPDHQLREGGWGRAFEDLTMNVEFCEDK